MASRPSYLCQWNSYTGQTTYLYWNNLRSLNCLLFWIYFTSSSWIITAFTYMSKLNQHVFPHWPQLFKYRTCDDLNVIMNVTWPVFTGLSLNMWNFVYGNIKCIWVRSQSVNVFLVTRLCYQPIAKPSNTTAAPSWPDPFTFRNP